MSRLPETGPSLIRHLRQMIRNENASPFTRSGSRVTGENEQTVDGSLRSWDYDGTSRAALGTTGWMLGPDDGGASLLALNGVDVYASLAAKIEDIATLQEDLATAQGTLADQVEAIEALVGAQVEVDDFNHTETGFDPVAGAWATVSSVTLTVPVGFTQAVVAASAYAGIVSAGGDIHCRALVAGVGGPADTRTTSPGQWRPVLSMVSHRVTGLTAGGTVAVACQAYVATDVGADAANTATVSGTVLWLR